jgi:aminoglycoside phosphotransferase (APT) family kinase protein
VPDVDPRDPEAVAERLRGWVTARFGGQVAVVGQPGSVGAGFDSYIHLVQLAGDELPAPWRDPLVVRLLPSVDRVAQSQREAEVQTWCAGRGYAAPAVLAVLAPDEVFGLPAQVMERAPGTTALDALKARPWRARALVDQLVDLQLRLHALDTSGWPGPAEPAALVAQRLSLPRRVAVEREDADLAAALQQAERLLPLATSGTAVICHGDFHPLNVVVDGSSASVIDWTDAGMGPREADVSRTLLLFNVAAIAATSSIERIVLRAAGPRLAGRYRRVYEQGAALDPARMRAWEALHALHGWSQILMLHGGGFEGDSSSDGQRGRVPVELATYLRRRFDAAAA